MSNTGAITSSIDIAQVVLYMFWIFFAVLIWYLLRENKREGYPLESDGRGGRVRIQGWPAIPTPKTFTLRDGTTRVAPGPNSAHQPLSGGEAVSRVPGSPIVPVGNPLLAGVGPGSWANRADEPDLTWDDRGPRIVPLRAAPGWDVSTPDPDPRGMPVMGADRAIGGVVVDLWVDRSEAIFRYLEVEVKAAGGKRRVLLPLTLARVGRRGVKVKSILGSQFADVPGTRHADQVTLLEEERIAAYYGAGTLYAAPSRQEPLL
jgi:photosynthetic reaction center H subunit